MDRHSFRVDFQQDQTFKSFHDFDHSHLSWCFICLRYSIWQYTGLSFDWLRIWHLIGIHLRSEEHTSELQSRGQLVCRLLLEKKKITQYGQRQLVEYLSRG